MKIATLNIKKRLYAGLQDIEHTIKKQNISILCLQETDIDPASCLPPIVGYTDFHIRNKAG